MNRLTLNEDKISNKDFNIEPKGYNVKEVDLFLDTIAKDYEIMREIIKDSIDEIEGLSNKLMNSGEEYKDIEDKNQILQSQLDELKRKGYQQLDIIERLNNVENKIGKTSFKDLVEQNNQIIELLKKK